MNVRRAPEWVRAAHLANERAQLSRDLRSANTVAPRTDRNFKFTALGSPGTRKSWHVNRKRIQDKQLYSFILRSSPRARRRPDEHRGRRRRHRGEIARTRREPLPAPAAPHQPAGGDAEQLPHALDLGIDCRLLLRRPCAPRRRQSARRHARNGVPLEPPAHRLMDRVAGVHELGRTLYVKRSGGMLIFLPSRSFLSLLAMPVAGSVTAMTTKAG